MREEKRRTENGVVYIDVIETTTYIERVITYPFGLQRVVRIKQAEPKPAPEAQAQIVIPKKKGIIAFVVALVLAALGVKAFNDHNHAEDFNPDFDDDDDVDYDEDDQDDDSEE